MTRDQIALLIGCKWRELLKSLDYGEVLFAVPTVAKLKSLRSVASDFNTDKDCADKFTVRTDRDFLIVTLTKSQKEK